MREPCLQVLPSDSHVAVIAANSGKKVALFALEERWIQWLCEFQSDLPLRTDTHLLVLGVLLLMAHSRFSRNFLQLERAASLKVTLSSSMSG